MSDRGRPHNLGQALFESLGAGLGAYGGFLEQERIRKSQFQQQSFLNRLQVEAGQRSQERLGIAQSTLDLSQERFGFEQEKFEIGQEIDPVEQSLIGLRGAQQGSAEALEAQRGATDLPAGVRSGMVSSFLQKAFETVDPETGAVTGIRKVPKFSLAQSPEEMAAIADSARSLGLFGDFRGVQQAPLEPAFPAIERPLTDGIPDSARAQMIAFLQQKYGEAWGGIPDEDKEILIQDAFRGRNQ